MKYQILNNEPLHFYNSAGELMGTISVSGSGDMIIRPESGSSRDIIIGDPNIAGDVQMGLVSAPINLELLGGGTITSNGNTLNIGSTANGDTVNLYNITYSQSLAVTGSINVTGSVTATSFVGDGSQLTGIHPIYTTASMVYSGSNVTQVTQSFGSTEQITNILYSGSFGDGNPLSIAVTGSDGINKLYTLTYSASLVTQIIQS